MSEPTAGDQTERPAFTIVRGNPDAAELAALTAVLLSAGSASSASGREQPQSGWAAYWRSVRAPLVPGPGSWQAAVRDW